MSSSVELSIEAIETEVKNGKTTFELKLKDAETDLNLAFEASRSAIEAEA